MYDWCCKTFQRMTEVYPQSGFSIKAFKDDNCDYNSFYVVVVPFDEIIRNGLKENKLFINKQKVPLGIPVELSFPIEFCPHCGKKLSPQIKKKQKQFNMLVEKHIIAEKILINDFKQQEK